MLTVDQLRREGPRPFRKDIDIGGGSGSLEDDEQQLLLLLDQTIEASKIAFNSLIDTKSKLLAAMSPSAKAALSIMGQNASTDADKLSDLRFEIEKRLAIVRRERSRTAAKSNYAEAKADYEKLKSHADAVLRGEAKVDEATRRRLSREWIAAEMRLRESA